MLHAAVSGPFSNVEFIDWLIKEFSLEKEISTKDAQHGKTPLHYAAQGGTVEMMHCLLEHGADKELTDAQGNNLLHLAATDDSPEKIQWLLSKGGFASKINTANAQGQTALSFADDISVFRSLLDHGADVYTIDSSGNNLLHVAATVDEEIVIYLLEKLHFSSKINDVNKKGLSPLQLAVKHQDIFSLNRNIKIMELLLTHGADKNILDSKGNTLLQIAVEDYQCWEGKIEWLIEKYEFGPKINTVNKSGKTPLYRAVMLKNRKGYLSSIVAMIRYLLDHGADTKIADKKGVTPLDLSIKNECQEIIDLLVSKQKNSMT